MDVVGRVESLWRYPVKSMRGERLPEAFAGFSGVYGDRLYAFLSSRAAKGFPFFTAREQEEMLKFRAVFRYPEAMAHPPNLAEAQALGPGVTPVYAGPERSAVDVVTPEGETLSVDDPLLIRRLLDGIRQHHEITLSRSDR